MSKYKPIRQKRYERLREAGFLANESHLLSKIPEKVPYLKTLVQDRKILFNKAVKRNLTVAQYKARIEKEYKLKSWSEYGIIANKKQYKMNAAAVYKMLREYEQRYKDEKGNQAFKSPWVKKQRDTRDFERKFENSFEQFHD